MSLFIRNDDNYVPYFMREPEPEKSRKAKVTGVVKLNVRDKPNGKIIGLIKEGTKIIIHSESGLWLRVSWEPTGEEKLKEGWVLSDYIERIEESETTEEPKKEEE